MGCIECWGARLVAFTLRLRLSCRRRRRHHVDSALGSGAKRRKGVARGDTADRRPRVSSRVPPFHVMDERHPLSLSLSPCLPYPHRGEAAVSVSRTFGTRVSVPLHLRSPPLAVPSPGARSISLDATRRDCSLSLTFFFSHPPPPPPQHTAILVANGAFASNGCRLMPDSISRGRPSTLAPGSCAPTRVCIAHGRFHVVSLIETIESPSYTLAYVRIAGTPRARARTGSYETPRS